MEICFSHIANYLRVVTSLTVLGDNEWLIGHSSHRHGVLQLSPTLSFHTCLTGCAGFCCPVCVSSSLLRCMCMFLEVTGNVINGCEAGSAVKGTWLVFVSAMIPQASKCWGIVLLESAGSGLVVQTANDWYCLLMNQDRIYETRENSNRFRFTWFNVQKSHDFSHTVHCCSTSYQPLKHCLAAVSLRLL